MNVWYIVALALALAGGILAATQRAWAVVLVAAAGVIFAAVRLF